MSIHSSLRRPKGKSSARNVMKRHERVQHLMDKGIWKDAQSVFGLPKIKQIRAKVRKAAKEAKPADGAAGAAAVAAPAADAKAAPKAASKAPAK